MRAYWTTNNAYDAIVFPENLIGQFADKQNLRDFLSDNPHFDNWSDGGVYSRMDYGATEELEMSENMSDDELAELAGDIIAYRDDAEAIVIVDHYLWEARRQFWGLD